MLVSVLTQRHGLPLQVLARRRDWSSSGQGLCADKLFVTVTAFIAGDRDFWAVARRKRLEGGSRCTIGDRSRAVRRPGGGFREAASEHGEPQRGDSFGSKYKIGVSMNASIS